jgi:UDP-N-acetylmuramoyl-tripeptide--D-alanyl-D-alanine ligase
VIDLTLTEVAEAVGGRLADVCDPAVVVHGPVVVDSRVVEAGGLFVAVPGERVDGHDFTAAAISAGAVAALVARPTGVPAIVVADTVAALGRLARVVLDRAQQRAGGGLRVVAVSGSSGKTSTKDLLAAVLERPDRPDRPDPPDREATIAAPGSYNNEIGLPLTVLRVTDRTRHLVLEMGARGPGHIAALCAIAPPTVGIVLNVGSAHAGEFGSREATARAKGELVEALPAAGLAVLNADDPLVRGMAARTAARVAMVGTGADSDADVRAVDADLDGRGRARFTLCTPAGCAPVALQLYGDHQVGNALAVAAAALELGMPLAEVAAALSAATPRSRWRMEVRERADGVTVVNDAYNANPESVRAALRTLAAMAAGRRTWAVLGEMLELGPDAPAEHDAIGRLAARLGVSRLVAVGVGARPVHLGASLEGSGDLAKGWDGESVAVPDTGAALDLLGREVRPGDVVLVKASRAAGLERVAEALLATDDNDDVAPGRVPGGHA